MLFSTKYGSLSKITYFFFVIIYREYHKNDLHAITSRLRGHLLGNKNSDVHLDGKGKKLLGFHFRLKNSPTLLF